MKTERTFMLIGGPKDGTSVMLVEPPGLYVSHLATDTSAGCRYKLHSFEHTPEGAVSAEVRRFYVIDGMDPSEAEMRAIEKWGQGRLVP